MSFKEKLKDYAGDFVRVGGALGMIATSINNYYKISPLPTEIVADYMKNFTGNISLWLSFYGLGEVINFYNETKSLKEKNENLKIPDIIEDVGKIMKLFPIASFPIAYATDGDFLKSIILPSTECIIGYGLEYLGKTLKAFRGDIG